MYIVLSQGSASFLLSLPDLPQLGQTFKRNSPFPTQKDTAEDGSEGPTCRVGDARTSKPSGSGGLGS